MNQVDGIPDVAKQCQELCALAAHLEAGRADILQAWRLASQNDASQSVAASLSRAEFYDHMPQVLDTLGDKLRLYPAPETNAQRETEGEVAAEHGAHRWQQGYNLQEMAREWALFNVVMVEVLDAYGAAHAEIAPAVLTAARRTLAELTGQSIASSVAEFDRLQRAEAETRARDLEVLLGERDDLQRARGDLMRETSHDLRGALSVVRGVATLLDDPRLAEMEKHELIKVLGRAGESLHEMLSQMLDLARLDAGREERRLSAVDVAPLLRELCNSLCHAAQAKGLTLECHGPAELRVEADAVKVERIAQNLLLNAIQYTATGGVVLEWSEHGDEGQQWALRVQDSGPGLAQGSSAPLRQELQSATQSAREVGSQSGPDVPLSDAPAPPANASLPATSPPATSPPVATDSASRPAVPNQTNAPTHGEGVGLMIVKKLCQLLDATLELDSQEGQGSLFRVVFPCRYSTP